MKKLEKFVAAHGGPKKFARKIGVHWRAVYFWLQGVNRPRHETQIKLVRLSGGRLRLSDFR